ncbi:MAG TPA: S8 family serine peptidase [Candidatus Binatia bacterium]|nr:S8 family serine peptidase [Candidatus Binatia bacterium]
MSVRQYSSRRWLAAMGTAAAVIGAVAAGPAPAQAASGPSIPKAYLSALSPQQIEQLSQNQNQKVIVVLRNQHPEAPDPGANRAALLASDQSSITGELAQLHAGGVRAYSFVNAVSATISAAEVARLQQDPAVEAVVPDSEVAAAPSTPQMVAVPTPDSPGTSTTVHASSLTEGSGTPAQACPTNPSQPLLEPEALQSMNVDFGPGGPPAAHSLANGAGVKVAVFPDGLDPNIPDFRTGGGTGPSAIFDYEDFTGEGTGGVTGGEEAFGDASSIIAQGNQTYDLSGEVNPAHPVPAGCTIKIEGVAPGASLAVMKVFGDTNFAFNSEILQGIEWAVNVDKVDILSESFGGNPVPNPGSDPIAVADQDAVNAGITVVVSSGDAGGTNTIGSPAVDPGVIAAGASTDYRLYQQTTSYGIQFGGNGWLSDQISGLSSSGVTEANRTVDLLAPGEAGWADCSTNTSVFTECADIYHGTSPQPIVAFGGTSESAPLTAGAAALVIQAFRKAHEGITPSPALVKQILMSTSRDVDSRAADQGAGLIDAYRAVQAALSYELPTKTGDALLYSPNAINSIAQPGKASTTPVTVTNDGAIPQTVTPSVRALGPARTIASGTLALNQATDPTFVWQSGASVGDVHEFTFEVPAGTDRLAASIAWNQDLSNLPSDEFQTIRFDLFDPEGRLVLQSRPQGPVGFPSGGFSQDEVHDAQAGIWTMLIFDTNFAFPPSYTGPLTYSITSQSFQTVTGSVHPTSAVLAPGASATFMVTVRTPATPGDTSESLVFGPAPGGDLARGTVPVTLRSLAVVGQRFSGIITGGNSRMAFYGQELPYQFKVSGHQSDVDVNLQVANPGYQILAFLVDPTGTPVDVQSSMLWDGSGTNGQTISLFRQNPAPGLWSLLVVQINNVDSVLTSTEFAATIAFNQVVASVEHLPTNPHQTITASSPVTALIHVTNTGLEPEAYMVDSRRDQQTILSLAALFASPSNEPLPISNGGLIPQFLVPPYTPAAELAATSTVPITLDTSPDFGTPDVEALSFGDDAIAVMTANELPASIWSCAPSEQGPFSTTAVNTTYSCGALGLTDAFAPDIATSAGNLWQDVELGTSTYNPLVLAPGQSGTIQVTITPTDPSGTHVSGFLSLETFNFNTFSSDEVTSFPYAYTVG